MNRSIWVLRVFLALICAFHVIVGLGLNVWPEFPKLMAGYYGAADFEWSPQFVYILRPLGAFMFALGVLAAFAVLNPLKYGAVCYGFSILFFLRAMQRVLFQAEIEAAFGIGPARNYTNAAFFLGMAIALVGLYFYAAIQSRKKRAK
jgi:hypothetical protein